jgi:hypothetical protein
MLESLQYGVDLRVKDHPKSRDRVWVPNGELHGGTHKHDCSSRSGKDVSRGKKKEQELELRSEQERKRTRKRREEYLLYREQGSSRIFRTLPFPYEDTECSQSKNENPLEKEVEGSSWREEGEGEGGGGTRNKASKKKRRSKITTIKRRQPLPFGVTHMTK